MSRGLAIHLQDFGGYGWMADATDAQGRAVTQGAEREPGDLSDDEAIRRAMRLVLKDAQLAVEPAAAASMAALCGPLRETLAGKRVGTICCGTNMAFSDFLSVLGAEAPL